MCVCVCVCECECECVDVCVCECGLEKVYISSLHTFFTMLHKIIQNGLFSCT